MALSRKTNRARAVIQKIRVESPNAREKRLTKQRRRFLHYYHQLSPSSRENVINAKIIRRRTQQGRESVVDKEQRCHKLATVKSQKRMYETITSRSRRITKLRGHAKNRREFESPSSRSARLKQMQEFAATSRALESPESCNQRLFNIRSQTRVRRKLLVGTDSAFDEAISQVADLVCYVCHKLLYKKQSRSISTTNISILPRNISGCIDCCNRCATKLQKNQCPSNAYWNNMIVASMPPEIECLSEMEIRLISRIKPFIKIVRLGGRFGQQGFKGQAVLFAQQVEEIQEQLPISAANAGLSIVTENLENVTSIRRYSVDIEKIKKALEWLAQNNHLYRNVQINVGITTEQLQSSVLKTIVTLENASLVRSEPQNHFKPLDNGNQILRGSFHQGSESFEEKSRGRQCTANAATAIAYLSSKPFREWKSSDLDRVLLSGNTYFNQCMSELEIRPQFLNTEELLRTITVANIDFHLDIQPDVVIGVINSSAPSEVLEGYFSTLSSGIQHFFSIHDKGIVTCETNIAVAVTKGNDYYYLFDSHSRGPKGFVAPCRGTSMLMNFPDQDSLCHHLAIVLQVKRLKDMQYSITAVNVSLSTMEDVRVDLSLGQNDIDMDNNDNISFSVARNPTNDNTSYDEPEFVTTALMPIDCNIPDLSDIVLNNNVEERNIPIYELRRKTAAPISALREQRAEELAWVRLFPDGRNGLKEQRSVPITPLDYFQTRVMSSDRRFQFNEYLFYALSIVELCKAQQNVSVCGRLRQDGAEPTDIVQSVHLVMRNIRGTSAYWHKAYTDLLAMVKNLGPPHWYLTLSCNDLNWRDMLKALLVADNRPNFPVEELTFSEKQHLVESYPVTLSRHFMLRLNSLFSRIRREHDPILGRKVIDFWWRIEFQLRGSPHVHMVLWSSDMPPFDSTEGTELLERVVTCEVPDAESDPEMHDLVVQLQTHRHTQTCYKNNRNVCRFSFPRPISESTKILDDEQAVRNGGRFYVLKRRESETMINCYSTKLLKLWRANIDL